MTRYYLNKESLIKYCKPEVLFETNGRKIDIEDKNVVEYVSNEGLPEFLGLDGNGVVYIPDEEELRERGLK